MRLHTSEIYSKKSVVQEAVLEADSVIGPAPDLISYTHPIKVRVQADLINTEILLSGEYATALTCICGRCLTPFSKNVQGTFKHSIELDQDIIDVAYYIKEAIILDLPPHTLCRESCLGLCANCGANRNETSCDCVSKPFKPPRISTGN